jgi:signal transduction histidine kinase/CheY-like chemotaxis protein
VPAFSARTVFDQFRDRPEYSSFFYKEATPNPTNPKDLADAFETELFQQFQHQPDLTTLSGYRTIANKRMYYTARPLVMREASCLQCHSTAAVAPKSQLKTYGDKTGFHWQLNDVIAAQTIYVPADEVFEHGWHNMTLIMAIFSAIFAIAVLAINRLLKRNVIQPIKHLTAIARHLSHRSLTPEQLGDFETPTIVKVAQRQDEPGQLARTFQHMAHEVAEREQILSRAVEDRTAQLVERTQEAQQANQAKSQFLANMSHELRTPLNIILGFSQLMARTASLDVTQQGYLNTINRSGEHLLGLINNVLELSKIEAGKITLNETDFDLHGVLDWLESTFQFKAQSKGIQFKVDRAANLPQQIRADESKLRQVLVNLINNAIKFTQAGQVTLRAIVDRANRLQFEVKDTGVGIAPTELKQLFQPFVQTESGRNAEEGTGLGLAIVDQFVHLMGGEITVESQVGVGTTFRFHIQALFVEAVQSRTAIHQPITGLAPGQPNYRILVVDDVPENRQLLVELLIPLGFEVQQANTGEAAIDLCRTWLPHLVWMDIRLPGINGYEATRRIKTMVQPSPIVIALTASVFEQEFDQDQEQTIALRCDDFVRKPFRAETIFEKLAAHLGVRYSHAASPMPEPKIQTPVQTPVQEPIQASLTSADLTVMSAEWIEQLAQAAHRVNAKLILKLLDQIPPEYQHLIERLTWLVNHFRFAEILTLTQPHLSQPESE